MAAIVSYVKSWMILTRAEVKRKHKLLHLFDCQSEGVYEVKFAKCDRFLVFLPWGLRKNLAAGLRHLSAGEKKVIQLFFYVEKITFF